MDKLCVEIRYLSVGPKIQSGLSDAEEFFTVRLLKILLLAGSMLSVPSSARAQTEADPFRPQPESGGGVIGFFDQAAGQAGTESVTIDTSFTAASSNRPAILSVTAHVAPGKHIYSITQPRGGPQATRIDLARSRDYRLLAPFRAHPQPHKRIEQEVWPGLEIQEHEGEVTWYAPIELAAGIDPTHLQIRGQIQMQACEPSGVCEPIQKEFAAGLVQNTPSQLASIDFPGQSAIRNPQSAIAGTFQARGSVVRIEGRLEPATVRPGESAQVIITAAPAPSWHVYAYSPRDDKPGSKPTLIAFAKTSGLIPNGAITDEQVNVDNSVPEFGPMRYHEGAVTWTARLDVPQNAPPGNYEFNGVIGYQACQSAANGLGTCEQPQAVKFLGSLQVGAKTTGDSAPLLFEPANYREASSLAAIFASYLDSQSPTQPQPPARTNSSDAQAVAAEAARENVPTISSSDAYDLKQLEVEVPGGRLISYIAMAFVGGLILNLMPCVLPVIGLKVMSFVEQAGRSRSHALVLNIWYAAGIVSVFLLLGLLAATINFAWGGQFGSTTFNVTIAAVVFAMALSLLGVWEVPIPGFFGSGNVQAAAAQEGPLGAFLKGVVTTVLATPCTAPFMASAVAWAIDQPTTITLVVFASLGFGMASPYLLVGVYPELLRFLPKPGVWMETFKQLMGFVLLATVVFILSFIQPAAVVPTIALLLGIGIACWLLARTPMTAEFTERLWSWAKAGAILAVSIALSVAMFRIASAPTETAWQPFSLEKLKQVAVDEGHTVLVDFSADWCVNCKFFEKTVLHTEAIKKAIERSGAVPMYADFTDYPQEINRTIRALGANGVPVIAIFPGDTPYRPIVFRGGYTKQKLINALQKAGSGRSQMQSSGIAEATAAAAPVN
jgi:thiol:disulfide interchange protein